MASIILTGFMGAGKSTVAVLLGKQLNKPVIDLDAIITEDIQMPISEYFQLYGEAAFRKKEVEILQEMIRQDAVIATGGGIITMKENRKILSQHPHVFYLKADSDTLIQRIRQDQKNIRPLATEKSESEIAALFRARADFYEEGASHIIETIGKTPEAVVMEIIERMV